MADAPLEKELRALRETLEKQQRLWRVFGIGVVKGLGVALGGTLFFSLVVSILTSFIDVTEVLPFVPSDLDQEVEQTLRTSP